MPSGSRVTRAAVVLHGRPEALGSGLARLESVAKQEGVELVVAGDGHRGAAGRRRGRDRARRRRDDAPGAAAVPRDGDPGDRRQLRPRRVPQRDPARRARARAWRASSPASSRSSSSRRSTSRPAGERFVAVNDAVVDERRARAHGRARMVARGRGLRPRPVRRAHLLDAVGLDGVQPLERRPGADVGPRRDGAHVRRPSRPARPAVRRAARPRPARLEPDGRTSAAPCSSTAIASPTRGPGRACRSGSASSARCSAPCPRRRSSAATGRASGARRRQARGAPVRTSRLRTAVRRARPVYHLHDAATPPDREPRPHP